MLFCKEPTCKSLAVVGGYCLSHQLERANELYAQLNQCNAYLQSAIEERNRAEFELSSARNTLRDIANGKYADPQNFAAVWINAHSFEPDVQA